MNPPLTDNSPDSRPARPQARRTWFGPGRLALLAGAASLAVTGLLWQQARQEAERELRLGFERETIEIRNQIALDLAAHALVLKSFAGLFNASTHVTRQDFRVFYESLGLDQGAHGSLISQATSSDFMPSPW